MLPDRELQTKRTMMCAFNKRNIYKCLVCDFHQGKQGIVYTHSGGNWQNGVLLMDSQIDAYNKRTMMVWQLLEILKKNQQKNK